ncbi:RNA-dependent RNA polymerase [Quillaja saponaria]|uniref:RNA-dependent RNA polymerase n=1 Tax=Quillaja saponaria TaxID=32244 RepID=A0AAD7LA55_QUISA|nr:RNA-dependent RNA polymerase [Quillaja saponaria]
MGKTIQLSGFPSDVSAHQVKVFLEQYTSGKTVYAIKIRQKSWDPRAYAIVQFTTIKDADFFTSLANKSLWAQITPCKVYFSGPEVNLSNRVLHHFHEYVNDFIRVSFVDEEWDKIYSTDLAPRTSSSVEDRRTGIYRRILSILRNGIVIGDKKFEFLAFSSSQLRENSMWMFASKKEITAAYIRQWMGNFSKIRNVAKYAARLGQSFGSSTETLSVGRHEIEIIPDVDVRHGGTQYLYTYKHASEMLVNL